MAFIYNENENMAVNPADEIQYEDSLAAMFSEPSPTNNIDNSVDANVNTLRNIVRNSSRTIQYVEYATTDYVDEQIASRMAIEDYQTVIDTLIAQITQINTLENRIQSLEARVRRM